MQKVQVFGLDYQSANFDLRERFAFSDKEIALILKRLYDSGVAEEVVILSTCNRTEVYCLTTDIDFIINAICDIQNICPRKIKTSCYVYTEAECVKHLFRVASGLTSMVLGESEIVAQIKNAIVVAKKSNTLGSFLSGVFHMALSTSKEVRNATKIGEITISMGSACVELATNYIKQELNISPKVLFIGAGKMMQQVAPHFNNLIESTHKAVINRTHAKTKDLALKIAAKALLFEQLSQSVSEYTIIVASCNSNSPLLTEQTLHQSIIRQTKLLIIDLSMPSIVDLNLKFKYNNITVFTLDDIAKIVDVGVEKRRQAAYLAESVIRNKLDEYQSWLKKRQLSPVIKALREDAEAIRQEIVTVALHEVEHGGDIRRILENLSIKLTNKLLHAPTVNLCVANDGIMQDNLVNLVGHLYDLELKNRE